MNLNVEKIATQILKKRQSPLALKEAAWRLVKFVAKCGQSNPVSFALRPLVSHPHLRTAVGLNIVVLMITATFFWAPVKDTGGGPLDLSVLPEGEVNLTTTQSVRTPLLSYHISQSFWLLHPGIDMATPIGQPIYPVMAGQVVKAEYGKFDYGNHVIVVHPNGYHTLYAHMSKIEVSEGDTVTTETEIGKVGSTGHSTGPHLHLEVHDENGRAINPKNLLEIK